MSLRHIDENDNDKKNAQNNFDIFPELDEIFDDFDAKKREELGLSKPSYEQHENYFKKDEAKGRNKLPSFDEELSFESSNQRSEENIHETEKPHEEEFEDYSYGNSNSKELKNEEEFKDDEDFNSENSSEENYEKMEIRDDEEYHHEEDSDEIIDDEDFHHVEDSEEKKEIELKEERNKENKNSGFKELDEEKAKEFFSKLFCKLKLNKNKKSKHSETKENKSKEKEKLKKDIEKEKFKFNKKGTIIISSVFVISVLIIVLFIFSNKDYSKINELSFSINKELNVDKIVSEKENVKFTISNSGDISKSIFFYVTIQEKGLIPFLGSKIECESDIIDITSGGGTESSLKCSQALDENKKYKYSESTISEI